MTCRPWQRTTDMAISVWQLAETNPSIECVISEACRTLIWDVVRDGYFKCLKLKYFDKNKLCLRRKIPLSLGLPEHLISYSIDHFLMWFRKNVRSVFMSN